MSVPSPRNQPSWTAVRYWDTTLHDWADVDWASIGGGGGGGGTLAPVAYAAPLNALTVNASSSGVSLVGDNPARTLLVVQNLSDTRIWVRPGASGIAAGLGRLLRPGPQPLATPGQPTGTPATSGGTLAAGTTYAYRIAANNGYGSTLPGVESAAITTTGSTSKITVAWAAVPGAQSYDIYGRVQNTEQWLARVAGGVTSFVDDNTLTPNGLMPAVDTSRPPVEHPEIMAFNSSGPWQVIHDGTGTKSVYVEEW